MYCPTFSGLGAVRLSPDSILKSKKLTSKSSFQGQSDDRYVDVADGNVISKIQKNVPSKIAITRLTRRMKMVEYIKDIITTLKQRGIGVLITDHNVRETLAICERAYIVSEGAVIAEGSPDEILANETVRQVYLGDDFTV